MSREAPKNLQRLPLTEDSVLLRTYFGDDAAWRALCDLVEAPNGEFRAYVTRVSDPEYADITVRDVVEIASCEERSFILVADCVAQTDPEHSILVVDLYDEPGRTFRVVPSAAWSVENNLSLANMGFEEFADAVDEHGVFRGF